MYLCQCKWAEYAKDRSLGWQNYNGQNWATLSPPCQECLLHRSDWQFGGRPEANERVEDSLGAHQPGHRVMKPEQPGSLRGGEKKSKWQEIGVIFNI